MLVKRIADPAPPHSSPVLPSAARNTKETNEHDRRNVTHLNLCRTRLPRIQRSRGRSSLSGQRFCPATTGRFHFPNENTRHAGLRKQEQCSTTRGYHG